MLTLVRRSVLLASWAIGLTLIGTGEAAGRAAQESGAIDIVEVNGYLDPVLVDFVDRALAAAVDDGAVALVLQLDSSGAVVGDDRLAALVDGLRDAPLSVGVWVGPSGAVAFGDAARLVDAADHVGVATGSRVELDGRRLDADTAREEGVADIDAPILGDFVVNLPGVDVRRVEQGDVVQLEPVTPARFSQLPLLGQLMHTVASPPVAYLLLVVGLALLVFELYTAGIGLAGVTGAACVVLGAYGVAVLPTRPLGVGLLLFSMFGYAVDVQAGVPRLWTGLATVAFVAGSLLLYDGVTLPWLTLIGGLVGVVLFFLAGMPAMVRARFSTSTIGREWMVGELGTARTSVDPDGVVVVRDAPWRARTNRATPVAAGDPVRVVTIEGLVLEVEPLTGAARGHRDRAGTRSASRSDISDMGAAAIDAEAATKGRADPA
ncbi:MAG: NfeD family protein [Acidimicrobiales bacterium]